jgi:class 3 adenylate cyclase
MRGAGARSRIRLSLRHSLSVIPQTRYAKSGDVHIGYRVQGAGRLDVVFIPGRTSNLDAPFSGETEELEALSEIARCIVFDKRGTGISDAVAGVPSLEERMDDVRAVMDAAGSNHAVLYGRADGGAMSVLFAATYPERTIGLLLTNPRPRFTRAQDYPWEPTREEYARETRRQVEAWGSLEQARTIAEKIGVEATDETLAALARRMRLAASPGAARALRALNADIDVRAILPSVRVPTLVLYTPERADVARYVADRMPNVELAEYNDQFIRLTEAFLERAWSEWSLRQAIPERVLATVLFTDLVRSTEDAVKLGPRWAKVLGEHNVRIRRELARHAGREIDTAGDGFFASGFDGPARAIRCGCAIRDAIGELGLGIRIGVHTGECDIVDGKLSGVTVAIGARVASQAEEGEVLVSGTVRDLVAGSGIEFESRGVRELKGLGEWPLYSVAEASLR